MHRADRIRNVALVGHRGSGKTSVNEALLFQAGAVNRLGTVLDGTTASDSDPDEQARQMSISASLSSFEWDDRKINLIDTPGEPSFVADSLGALRVCESAIFVINAVMGAEVNALKAGTNHGGIFPVVCGVATKNLGTNRLLDAIVEDLPSPVKHGAFELPEITLVPDEDKELFAFVFKTKADQFAGRINFFRV